MEIKKIRLNNVGRFTNLEIAFAPTDTHASKVTVFVGNNGAGKTTILKSLATSLSWLIARIRTENGNGSPISEDWISNGKTAASIQIEAYEPAQFSFPGQNAFGWTVARTRLGRKSTTNSELVGATQLAECYRDYLTIVEDKGQIPLMVLYPVERSVLEVPPPQKSKAKFDQLDGYENALNQGIDFGRFFEWFKTREDSENESGISTVLLSHLKNAIAAQDNKIIRELERMHVTSRDAQLNAVRSAISAFMPGFENLRVRRRPHLQMTIDKAGKTLNVAQLSQGEKSMMALVSDIARRLAIMNPSSDEPLKGNGIVMIDEVDLHLHPQWQRRLIHQLTATFPNCQFILTTHSPLVISDSKGILCYVLDDGELEERDGLYGMDANQVLMNVMDTDVRNSEIQDRLDRLLELVQEKQLPQAKSLYKELSLELPSGHIELAKAALLIRKMELRGA
jgi:predicted ATP-binding protein involved in virulence